MIGIDHLTCSDVDVAGLVVHFNPRLIELVTDAYVQRQFRKHPVVILNKSSRARLPLSDEDAAERSGSGTDAVEQKVRTTVSTGVGSRRIACKCSAIGQCSEEFVVVARGVVVLVALRIDAKTPQVQTVLPRHVIDVGIRVVGQAAEQRGGTYSA